MPSGEASTLLRELAAWFGGSMMAGDELRWREVMAQAYRTYCRVAAAVFLLITVYTMSSKLAQGRLAEDWLHSVLHLGSALAGAVAGWDRRSALPATWFTWGIGLLYGALGLYGWFTTGFFLNTRAAIPLGPADNLFHLALAAPALAIAAVDRRRSVRAGRPAEWSPW